MLDLDRLNELTATGARLVPATKTVPPEIINLLPQHGVFEAGENRVQEFLQKYPLVNGIKWHFIGRLQTNKVKYIVDKVEMIQSVDRVSLADEIEKHCAAIGKVMPVLIEVNCGEASKGGTDGEGVLSLADYVAKLPHLKLCGLMCVPPIGADESVYEEVHRLYIRVKRDYPDTDVLSMGMSADYEIALRHGANMIRPGRALFGERIYNKEAK